MQTCWHDRAPLTIQMTVVFNSKLLVKRIQLSFVNCLLCDVKSKWWQTSREPISLQCLRICHVNSCEPCSSGASFKGLKDWFLFLEWEIRVRFPVEHLKYKPGCAISQFLFLTGFVWMFTVSTTLKCLCVCVQYWEKESIYRVWRNSLPVGGCTL